MKRAGSRRNRTKGGGKDIREENLNKLSPSGDPENIEEEDEDEKSKPRLQRQKAQSRKTFRFRKSRKGNDVRPGQSDSTAMESNLSLSSLDFKESDDKKPSNEPSNKNQSEDAKNCNTQEPSENSALLDRLFSIKTDTLPV